MNLFEFENQQFPGLWTEETIKGNNQPDHNSSKESHNNIEDSGVFDSDWDNDLYRQFQESNILEYFDWARTYIYCLYK